MPSDLGFYGGADGTRTRDPLLAKSERAVHDRPTGSIMPGRSGVPSTVGHLGRSQSGHLAVSVAVNNPVDPTTHTLGRRDHRRANANSLGQE